MIADRNIPRNSNAYGGMNAHLTPDARTKQAQ
jgi:hypothetical protein